MFLIAIGQFLLGVSAGLAMSGVQSGDAEMTNRSVARAQRRVDHLRDEADRRVVDVYSRYSSWMGPDVRRAYGRRRMTT